MVQNLSFVTNNELTPWIGKLRGGEDVDGKKSR
jgi:hypothetical protein